MAEKRPPKPPYVALFLMSAFGVIIGGVFVVIVLLWVLPRVAGGHLSHIRHVLRQDAEKGVSAMPHSTVNNDRLRTLQRRRTSRGRRVSRSHVGKGKKRTTRLIKPGTL